MMNEKHLSVGKAVAIVVGLIIGAGIFKTPSLVAQNSSNATNALWLWIIGGLISFIGALCYAELSNAFPSKGGDYHFLRKAYGRKVAFLFGWARITVLQTGSIAMLAFLIGDYATAIINLGFLSPTIYAALTILIFTFINVAGVRFGTTMQVFLFITVITGITLITITGLLGASPSQPFEQGKALGIASPGRAMIFVLLTYGGWNEAAYLSAEVKRSLHKNNILRLFLYSIVLVTAIYFLVNMAYLKGLSFEGVSNSQNVASDLMENIFGSTGALFISVLVMIASAGTVNATIITGARSGYALGKDFLIFRIMGRWNSKSNTPVRALLVQAILALLLVLFGTGTRNGFVAMVEYTVPVFWFFFLLSGISLIVLRHKEKFINRPFLVPLYPFLPIVFCLVCIYMLYAGIAHTGIGAILGITILMAGVPFLIFDEKLKKRRFHVQN